MEVRCSVVFNVEKKDAAAEVAEHLKNFLTQQFTKTVDVSGNKVTFKEATASVEN